MTYKVLLSESAISDLDYIQHWIASEADSEVARAYIDRITQKFASLVDFPHRGTPRPDFADGCRSLSFERRYVIVYRVIGDIVRIERVADGLRNLEWLQ